MLPILSLAIIFGGLINVYDADEQSPEEALRLQTEHYFEAISAIINADRDIYQARLAQKKIFAGEGLFQNNRNDFEENAQQVFDRFQQYRQHLADEPKALLAPFEPFDALYKDWINASRHFLIYSESRESVTKEFINLDQKFQVIRNMLDEAGEKLRQHTREIEQQQNTEIDLERYLEAAAEVLHADPHDFYQAHLAQQKIISGAGSLAENKADFEQNAQQVLRRFNAYRVYLVNEPQLASPYANFDTLFNEWLQASRQLINSSTIEKKASLPGHGFGI
ncbi:hypothetical protein P4S72_13960 [Vibrio sp. PP-XX7]